MSFGPAVKVATHEGVGCALASSTQTGFLGKVVGVTSSLHETGQHPAIKQTPLKDTTPDKALGDSDEITQGVGLQIGNTLTSIGEDITALHTGLSLQMAQPDAFLKMPLPGVGKASRDATAQTFISHAGLNASTQMATGNGVERCNEDKAVIAKNFFRQAGMVILDFANIIVHSANVVSTRALKYLVRVTDFDILAEAISAQANTVALAVQEVTLLVAKKMTISVGKKLKLVLHDNAELAAQKDLMAQILGNFELTANQVKLAAVAGIELKTPLTMTFKALNIKLEAATTLTISAGGLALSMSAAGFSVNPDLTGVVVPTVLPTPVLLPTALGVKPVSSGTIKAPVVTNANIGRVSSPADTPKAVDGSLA